MECRGLEGSSPAPPPSQLTPSSTRGGVSETQKHWTVPIPSPDAVFVLLPIKLKLLMNLVCWTFLFAQVFLFFSSSPCSIGRTLSEKLLIFVLGIIVGIMLGDHPAGSMSGSRKTSIHHEAWWVRIWGTVASTCMAVVMIPVLVALHRGCIIFQHITAPWCCLRGLCHFRGVQLGVGSGEQKLDKCRLQFSWFL